MSVLGNFIAENQAGGMIVPSDMTKYLFNMVHALIKNDIAIDENKNFTMTKK